MDPTDGGAVEVGDDRQEANRSHAANPSHREGMSMSPDDPHDQCGTAHPRADEVAIDTFTVRLPRWPVLLRLLGRDPLVRTTARIEALVIAHSMPSRPRPATPWSRRSPTSRTPRSCDEVSPPCRRGGLPPAPNIPAQSRRYRQPKLVTAAATAVTPLPSRMLFTDACISPFVTRYW